MQTNYALALSRILKLFGADTAFGMTGGYTYTEWEAMILSGFKVFNCSHEEGAAFSASECSLCTDRISIAFSTAGPGFYHSMNGLRAARFDGSKVVYLGGITSYEASKKWEVQPTTEKSIRAFAGGKNDAVFNEVFFIKGKRDFQQLIGFLKEHASDPCGFVIGVFMLNTIQKQEYENWENTERDIIEFLNENKGQVTKVQDKELEKYAEEIALEIAHGKSILWNGYGVRKASELFIEVAEATGSKVMSTPRGKGVFPETHPLYIGSTGMGSYGDRIREAVESKDLRSIIIFGTRLGELSSSYIHETFKADKKYYYVGLETEDMENNLPVGAIPVRAEIGYFLERILAHLDKKEKPVYQPVNNTGNDCPGDINNRPNPKDVMEVIQKVVIERTDSLVAGEAGNGFAWTSRYFTLSEPNRYHLSPCWGSMSHYACGLLGMAASGRQAVGVIGDGSMLMVNELATAAKYNLPAIWIVLNEGFLNMVRQGLNALGCTPLDCSIPTVDFAAYARSVGAKGYTARNLLEFEAALMDAVNGRQPAVIDVWVDQEPIAPTGDRIKNLKS